MSTIRLVAWAFGLRRVDPLEKLVAIYFAEHAIFNRPNQADLLVNLFECGAWCGCKKEEAFGALDGLSKFGLKLREVEDYKYLATLDMTQPEAPPPPPQTESNLTLYVLTAGGATKVGITRDLKVRMDRFRSGSPLEFKVLLSAVGPRRSIFWVEQSCLADLVEHRIHGEWLSCSSEIVLTCVRALLRKVGVEPKEAGTA